MEQWEKDQQEKQAQEKREKEAQAQKEAEKHKDVLKKKDAKDEKEDPIQDRTVQAGDDFEKITQKLVKARDRYFEAAQKANENEGDSEKLKDKRTLYFQEYSALVTELNRLVNIDVNKPSYL